MVNRDFLRDAVFALMTPRFAALSIALYTVGSSACASLVFPALRWSWKVLTSSWSTTFLRMLYIRFLRDARWAFFAPRVIAICGGSIA